MKPPVMPSLLLGIGLILQWHHLLTAEGCCSSTTVAGLEDNTLADGFFRAATWVAVMAGTIAATRAWQRGELAPPWRAHLGGLVLGWGAFNLIEGLIDHSSSESTTFATTGRAPRVGPHLSRLRRPAVRGRLRARQGAAALRFTRWVT